MAYDFDHRFRRFGIAFTAALLLLQGSIAHAGDAPQQASEYRLVGTVRDSLWSPMPGVSVRIEKSEASSLQRTTTDGMGNFAVSVPTKGTYALRIEKPGFRKIVESVTIPRRDSVPLDIVLVRSQSRSEADKLSGAAQFSDSPNFTIAGVTDWTAAGGHGSDVALRTSEAFAKETHQLGAETSTEIASGTAPPESKSHLRDNDNDDSAKKRDQLRQMLADTDRADLHRLLGDVDEHMNDSLAAVHEYQRATQLEASEQNYFAWASELLLHRAIQPALDVFTKGAHAYPSSERMLAGLGAALYASGLYAQAAERFCAASDLNPADPTPYLFLGRMARASPEPLPCSGEKLARFSREQPENALANYYYAVALWKEARDSDKATAAGQVESLLKKSIGLDPKFPEAYLQLGIVYFDRGEFGKAVAAYRTAIAVNPNLAEAHFRLGQAYKKTGEPLKASKEFQAHQRIQQSEALAVEQQRREIQQFVVVFKDQPQMPPTREP